MSKTRDDELMAGWKIFGGTNLIKNKYIVFN